VEPKARKMGRTGKEKGRGPRRNKDGEGKEDDDRKKARRRESQVNQLLFEV
jgi:hypothetical protein